MGLRFFRPTLKRGANIHRAYGTPVLTGASFPTLKRGANKHCAYGAGLTMIPHTR